MRGRKGEYKKELREFARQGFVRVRIDGDDYQLDTPPDLDRKKRHDIDLVIDRLVIRDDVAKRLADSLETALKASAGFAKVDIGPGHEEVLFSELAACMDCGASFPEINPRLFSFNSPQGACPECDGSGTKDFFDAELLVPDPNVSLEDGAIAPFKGRGHASRYYASMLRSLATHYGFELDTPWKKLPAEARAQILTGSDEKITFRFGRSKKWSFDRNWTGVTGLLDKRYRETESDLVREGLRQYMSNTACTVCAGARLRPEARSVFVGGTSLPAVCALSVLQAVQFFSKLSLGNRIY